MLKNYKGERTMKKNTKIIIAVAAVTAVASFVAGVIYELNAIKKITTDADDALPEEILAGEIDLVENAE